MITSVQHVLKHGAYNSVVAEGKRIRRMLRTELSLQKICTGSEQILYNIEEMQTRAKSQDRGFYRRTQPKIQSVGGRNKQTGGAVRKVIQIRYEYYDSQGRPQCKPYTMKSLPKSRTVRHSEERRSQLNDQPYMQEYLVNFKKSPKQPKSTLTSKSMKGSQGYCNDQENAENSAFDRDQSKKRQNMKSSKKPGVSYSKDQYQFEANLGSKKEKGNYSKKHSNKKVRGPESSYKQSAGYGGDSQYMVGLQSNKNLPTEKRQKLSSSKGSKMKNSGIDHISGRISVKSYSKNQFRVLEDISLQESEKLIPEINTKSKPKSNLRKSFNESRGLSLKLDSIRNDQNYNTGGETSRDRGSFRNLPLTSRQPSLRRNLSNQGHEQPCSNNIEDVYQRIEIYNYLLGMFSEYSEGTISFYEEDKQNYQILCYLLDYKFFYEKVNLLKSLTSQKAKNVFILLPIEIPNEILHQQISHDKIKDLARDLQEFRIAYKKKLDQTAKQLYSRHKEKESRDLLMLLEKQGGDTSPQIIRKLKKQMEKLYQDRDQCKNQAEQETYQNRMIETMELIFFMSELAGRKVKKIQFVDQIPDFQAYYDKYLPKLIETYRFFDKLGRREPVTHQ